MKRSYYILILICFLTISCSKEELIMITRYQGIVLEQSEKQPIEGLLTMLTDGTTVFDSTRTDIEGKFFLTADWSIMDNNYYLFIDGEGRYPSKKTELTGTRKEQFDFFYLYLYDKNTLDATPTINKDVSVNYVNENIEFSNIVISSPYTLTEASIVLTDMSGEEIHYPLEQKEGKYSVIIENLTIGEWYYWTIYAANRITNSTSEPDSLLYGFQNITITPITKATTNSVIVTCDLNGNCPYAIEEVGFCWGMNNQPSANNSIQAEIKDNTFTGDITNVDFTITSYIWAYIRNKYGVAYSKPIVLCANNPLGWFEFQYRDYTYTVYEFIYQTSWYKAVDACERLDKFFDDWILPNYEIVETYISAYISKYRVLPYTNVWATRREMWMEEGESETFLSTPNGWILENKNKSHSFIAVRKYKK